MTLTTRNANHANPAAVPISNKNASSSYSDKSRPESSNPTLAPRKPIAEKLDTCRSFMCLNMRDRVRNAIRTASATMAVKTMPLTTPMTILSIAPNMGPRDSIFCSAESCTSSGTAFSTSGSEGDSLGSPGSPCSCSVPNRNIASILSARTELNLETARLTAMLNITDLRNTRYDPATVMPRAKLEISDASAIVDPIIDQVRHSGAEAVLQ